MTVIFLILAYTSGMLTERLRNYYKEKQHIKPLVDALEDIKNWDDDLEVEWGDCGYRAITALKEFNNQNQ